MSDDASFAPPPFKADQALQTLRRELRALGLSEREGGFERRGLLIARATLDGGLLRAARIRRPSRSSPEWQHSLLQNGADVRSFVADLKKQLALWGDSDD